MQISTLVGAVRCFADGVSIATFDNIVRASGGGEPADHVVVSVDDDNHLFDVVEKAEGYTWMRYNRRLPISVHHPVIVRVDEEHRLRRRRLHTAVHIAIRTALNLHPALEVTEAEIAENVLTAIVRTNVAKRGLV